MSIKYVFVLSFFCITAAHAQSSSGDDDCAEIQDLIYYSASLWPSGKQPVLRQFQCALESSNIARCHMLVPRKDNTEESEQLKKRLMQCASVTFTPDSTITPNPQDPSTFHRIGKFQLSFRGQSLEGDVRTVVSSKNPSMLSLSLKNRGTVATSLGISKDKFCNLLGTIVSPEALADNWKYWRGIAQDTFDGNTTYMCAKVPVYAQSRFDCELQLGSNGSMSWAVRWMYPQTALANIHDYSKTISEIASTCYPGTLLQNGTTRHQLHNPKMGWRATVQSRQNDVGRGPTVEFRVSR